MAKLSDARLVLFSDDIANVVESPEMLQVIYGHISDALAWFGMLLDDSKSQFIRFGDCDTTLITLRDRSGQTHPIRFSESIR